MEKAIDKLIKKIQETQNPTAMGLDPRYEMLPQCVTSKYAQARRTEALRMKEELNKAIQGGR